ncbi:unnamed protein product, partial [Schistosoma mattheei]
MQAVLVSFQNNALDELAAPADRILEIMKSNAEVFSVKEKPQTTQNDITELCHTLTRYLNLRTGLTIKHMIDPLYQPLLDKYPGMQQTQPRLPCVTSNVTHHITTTGPPVFSKARRLAPEKL